MATFILRRVVSLLFVLFCVVSITFLLIRLAPGGPFDRERKIPPQIEKELLAKYKLDGPLWDAIPRLYVGPAARRLAALAQVPEPLGE